MAQEAKGPVATLWTARLIVSLTLSLLLNVLLGALYYVSKQDVALAREMQTELVDERDILMRLIPDLTPTLTPTTLATVLRSRYPGEEVNVGQKQVQWRLFHFWFDERGRLVEVQWSS
jgi:hypothetical protein